MFDIWNNSNNLAEKAYQLDNYKINIKSKGGGYCVIYCTSNNLWYPNERWAFEDSILKKDYFEWQTVNCALASKEIYVRDIYKSWYVTGANFFLDTIDKLVEFLKKQVQGFPVITIGSSAGGYLAVILGYLLKADHVIAFSAQYELENQWAMDVNPFLKKYANDSRRNKYYRLKEVLKDCTVPVFYIVPVYSEVDRYHYNYIKDVPCIKPILFKSKHHGVVLPKDSLAHFISMNVEKLNEIYDFYYHHETYILNFLLKTEGLVGGVFYVKRFLGKVRALAKKYFK